MRKESIKEEPEDEEEVEAEAEQDEPPSPKAMDVDQEKDDDVHDPTAAASDAARPAPGASVARSSGDAAWSRTRPGHGRTRREGHGRRAMGSQPLSDLSGSNCGHCVPHPPRAYRRGTGTHHLGGT